MVFEAVTTQPTALAIRAEPLRWNKLEGDGADFSWEPDLNGAFGRRYAWE